jgi:hypothetical protein
MKNEGRKVLKSGQIGRRLVEKERGQGGKWNQWGENLQFSVPLLDRVGGGVILFYFQSLVFSFLYEFPLYKTVKRTFYGFLRIQKLQLLIKVLKKH